MNPTPRRPLPGHSTAACVRPPQFPAPNTIVIQRPKSEGPQPIGSILDDILRSPGGFAGEARRILARTN